MIELRLREVGVECRSQSIARDRRLLRLPHHRGPDDHTERVEGDRRAVAIGVHHDRRLQHSVVVRQPHGRQGWVGVPLAAGDPIAQRVTRLLDEEIVVVVDGEALSAHHARVERITRAVRQEEMRASEGKLLRRRVGRSG